MVLAVLVPVEVMVLAVLVPVEVMVLAVLEVAVVVVADVCSGRGAPIKQHNSFGLKCLKVFQNTVFLSNIIPYSHASLAALPVNNMRCHARHGI